jgi:hypothetical protein
MVGIGVHLQVNQLAVFAKTLLIGNFVKRVQADGGTIESFQCLDKNLRF